MAPCISTPAITQNLELDTKRVQAAVCKCYSQENMLTYSEESIVGQFASKPN
jgi:hypothetical protein